jgi:hypothetical protein
LNEGELGVSFTPVPSVAYAVSRFIN